MRKIFLVSTVAFSLGACTDMSAMLTPDNITLMSNGMSGVAKDIAQGTAKMSQTVVDAFATAAIAYCNPLTKGGRDTLRGLVNNDLEKRGADVRLGDLCVATLAKPAS